jgi:hypothetical protein
MAVFIAGADESGSGDRTGDFYFGGFVASAAVWGEEFEPAWRELILTRRPRLSYLHVADLKSERWRASNSIREIDAERKIEDAFRLIGRLGELYPITSHLDASHVRSTARGNHVEMQIGTPGGVARKPFEPDFVAFLRFALHDLHYVRESDCDAERLDFVVERNGPITRSLE